MRELKQYQSLVDLVVIYIELGREDYSSTTRNCDRERLKALDAKTDPEPN
jgi:hypothetical protein